MPQARPVAEMSSGIEFDIGQREKNEDSRHSDSPKASRSTGVLASRNPRMTSWTRANSPSFNRFVSLANSISGIREAGKNQRVLHVALAGIEIRSFELCREAVTDCRLAEMAD